MSESGRAYENVLKVLDEHGVDYRLFHHRPIRTYEDSRAVQDEAGFFGTEGKCVVLRADADFVVYTTIQGNRVDLDRIRDHLDASKVRMAWPEELRAHFGVNPGSAYPFGFDAEVRVFVDPAIYEQEWVLFSPALPTATVQVRGRDLRRVFGGLTNPTEYGIAFNR